MSISRDLTGPGMCFPLQTRSRGSSPGASVLPAKKNRFKDALMFSLSRRELLQSTSCGFGALAFAGLFGRAAKAAAESNPLAPKQPHFEPKAKRVIFMFMQGAPSHVDTFDYKPAL